MNANDFVRAIQTEVRDAAIDGVMSMVERPPGRRPSVDLLSLSRWFNALTDGEKLLVRKVAALASDQATFGFLTILDGARAIEDSSDKGSLELHYTKRDQRILLNDRDGKSLHELFQRSDAWSESGR